jgi:hypothetical protein
VIATHALRCRALNAGVPSHDATKQAASERVSQQADSRGKRAQADVANLRLSDELGTVTV